MRGHTRARCDTTAVASRTRVSGGACSTVWIRQPNEQAFRRVLCCVAYGVSKGAYRRCWVRFGYDLRSDPTSAIYQLMETEPPAALADRVENHQLRHNRAWDTRGLKGARASRKASP